MKRKIIQIAQSTQLVSLPRKWALRHGLKKGDEVEIIEEGDELVIQTGKEAKQESVTIDLTKSGRLAERFLITAYRSGYDEVRVLYNDPGVLQRLQKTASNILLGFEIVSQSENLCIFRNISTSMGSEFENILRRVFYITLDLSRNTYDAVSQGQYGRLTEGLSLEVANNKFTLFCQRVLNKQGEGSYRRTTYLFLTAYQLEKVADHYKYICDYLLKQKNKKLRKETLKFFKDTNAFFEAFHDYFYKYDSAKAEALAEQYEHLTRTAQKTFQTVQNFEDEIVYNLLSVVQLTFNLTSIRIGLEI